MSNMSSGFASSQNEEALVNDQSLFHSNAAVPSGDEANHPPEANTTDPIGPVVNATNTNNSAPVVGSMDELWEPSTAHLQGADAPAETADGCPLLQVGTFKRNQFDRANEVVLQVLFKIHTESEVVIINPANKTLTTFASAKVAPGRRTAGTAVNVIDSKVFNNGLAHELRVCLYGKSFNQFRAMCAELCERYAPGMHQMVLNSDVAANLTWKATVGRTTPSFVLQDHNKYFEYVAALMKSRARRGILLIYTESSKLAAKKKAQASAAKQLIASTNGPVAVHAELSQANERLEASQKLVALHQMTAELFHQHAEVGNAGGNGVVLVAPWDPDFHYRFTLADAYIWAESIQKGEASKHMPPNNAKYCAEIAKTRVLHPGLKLKDCLKLRFLPTPKDKVKASAVQDASAQNLGLVGSLRKRLFQADVSPSKQGGKRFNLGSPVRHAIKMEPDVDAVVVKISTAYKKEATSDGIVPPADNKLFILTDGYESKEVDEMSSADSDKIECLREHEALLDNFVKECGVTRNYDRTRNLLINSGIKSWIDLVPSVKMTAAALMERGIERQLAGRMLDKAEARHLDMLRNVEHTI
ncbi:hypothetical protein DFH28DRAFT_1189853 [Melampsora americana]|nr:hypothetical protein DFH28DRAFT_1189853 [Melampsora americana]